MLDFFKERARKEKEKEARRIHDERKVFWGTYHSVKESLEALAFAQFHRGHHTQEIRACYATLEHVLAKLEKEAWKYEWPEDEQS